MAVQMDTIRATRVAARCSHCCAHCGGRLLPSAEEERGAGGSTRLLLRWACQLCARPDGPERPILRVTRAAAPPPPRMMATVRDAAEARPLRDRIAVLEAEGGRLRARVLDLEAEAAGLRAALAAALDPVPGPPGMDVRRAGDLAVDLGAQEARLRGARVPLSRTEFRLLAYLARRQGRAVPRAELVAATWGESMSRSILRTNLNRIRGKLDDPNRGGSGYHAEHRYIRTVPGVGYCFPPEDDA